MILLHSNELDGNSAAQRSRPDARAFDRSIGKSWRVFLLLVMTSAMAFGGFATSLIAQIHVAHLQPDAVAPGMTIALEIMANAKDSGAFGNDGLGVAGTQLEFANASDSGRVTVGPPVTSWSGRVVQVPMIIARSAAVGPLVFRLRIGSKLTDFLTLSIVRPSAPISIVNGALLGSGSFTGTLTSGNTMVVDSITLSGDLSAGSVYQFPQIDTSLAGPGNLRYLPITILSVGSVRFTGAHLSLDADTLLNGGPGGGGGGHGNAGFGGSGFTAGGNDSTGGTTNIGTGSGPTDSTGGASITGVLGGGNDTQDQGGGGGTGAPYGTSGSNGVAANPSPTGGYGGGSAGGEFKSDTTYGGGGGGFGTAGQNGGGQGANGGHVNGGRFLIPLAGGSGGGAGNAFNEARTAGSGGGGGGALSLISFGSIIMQNGLVTANGGNGTSGKGLTAGGGGGSGGAFLFAAKRGFSESNLTLTTSGGDRGLAGSVAGTNGGVGGLGRIRIDGEIPGCLTCSQTGVAVSGPSLDPNDTSVTTRQITVTGFDEDTFSLSDSIRIYYRTRHTAWHYADTIRYLLQGHHRWQKMLPNLHDSLVQVIAYAQVRNPSKARANEEPDWLVSHISIGTIRERPSAFVSPGEDSIDFACVKIGNCLQHRLAIRDLGEASARVDSVIFDDPLNFSSDVITPFQIAPYVTDSVTVQFCPWHPGSFFTKLHIYSNDSVRTLTVRGCGLSINDSIALRPKLLDFGRIHVGLCDTLNCTITAAGTDTSRLQLRSLFTPPFHALTLFDSIVLAPGASSNLSVEFCPSDTGNFTQAVRIGGDSLHVVGQAVRAILSVSDTLIVAPDCLGKCVTQPTALRNIGNDTATVTGLTFTNPALSFTPNLPIRVLPHDSVVLTWTYCGTALGSFTTPVTLISKDSILRSVIVVRVESIKLPVHPIDLGVRCLDADSSVKIALVNAGADSLFLLSGAMAKGVEFALTQPIVPSAIKSHDSVFANILYHTTVAGSYVDTLVLTVRNGACDSMIKVAFKARSTQEAVVLSDSLLDFGNVEVDSCKSDSIVISNPCGVSVIIAPPKLAQPFTLIAPVDTFLLTSGSSRTILFDYCPKKVAKDSLAILLRDTSSHFYDLKLRGYSFARSPSVVASLSVSRVVAQLGSNSALVVSLDSLSGASQVDSLSGTLNYDGAVFLPLQATALRTGYIVTGREIQPGQYDFGLRGAITVGGLIELSFTPLVGQQDSTRVSITNPIMFPSGVEQTKTGSVKIQGCGNLPGSVSVAGAYRLDPIGPNPASGAITVRFTLGNDGPVTLSILDLLGAERLVPLSNDFLTAGDHQMTIPLESLGSGLHFLRIESLGWRKTSAFIISK